MSQAEQALTADAMPSVNRGRFSDICSIVIVVLVVAGSAMLFKGGYMQAKAMFAQFLIEKAWAKSLTDGQAHKPWSWADTHPTAKLWIGKHEPLYVLAGASGRNLAFGPAQMLSGAGAGETGNTVIAGHRDTHFAILAGARVGQEIRLQGMDGQIHFYRIRATAVVHESETRWLMGSDERLLTLITCYPFDSLSGGAELRFVVQAEALQTLAVSA